MMKIGFIGLGIMGQPMCRNIMKAGYPMKIYARHDDIIEQFRSEGAEVVDSVAACAEGVDVLITMLPNSPEVREVLLAEGGAIETLKAGSCVIDMSSINPLESQAIAAILAEKNVDFMDAPVSGGEPKAIDGSLSVMVGGAEAVFEKHYDLLMTMAATVVRVGEVGAGNTAKLANKMIVAVNIAAVAEAMVFAKKAGVDPQKVYEAIRAGLAGSNVLDAKVPMMIERTFKPGFRVSLHRKDLDNAQTLAESIGADTPFTDQAMDILNYLIEEGYEAEDHSSILRFFETEKGSA